MATAASMVSIEKSRSVYMDLAEEKEREREREREGPFEGQDAGFRRALNV